MKVFDIVFFIAFILSNFNAEGWKMFFSSKIKGIASWEDGYMQRITYNYVTHYIILSKLTT